MAKVSDFLTYVLPSVPGCSEPLATQHVRDALIDFCTRSLILQKTLDPVSITPNIRDYDLVALADTDVVQITQAWLGTDRLVVISAESATAPMFNATVSSIPGTPRALLQNDYRSFTLDRSPDVARSDLTLRAALRPTRKATTVDDLLFTVYVNDIAAGAISRLARIPNQSFTSIDVASINEAAYNGAVSKAKVTAYRAFGRSLSTVRMRPFA